MYSKLIYLGQTGLGKSTLVNTLFASHLIDSKGRRNVDEIDNQTTRIEAVSHGKSWKRTTSFLFYLYPSILVIEENGVRLRLNIVDTPGYGDQVNNEDW